MPGLQRSEIKTELDGSLLKITGHHECPTVPHREGLWKHVRLSEICIPRDKKLEMYLPSDCDTDHGNATLSEGILSVKFPLHRDTSARRYLPVQSQWESEHILYAKTRDTTRTIWHKIKDVLDYQLLHPLGRIWGSHPIEKIKEQTEKMGQKAGQAGESIRSAGQVAEEKVREYAESVREGAQEGYEYTSQKAGEAISAQDQAKQAGESVTGSAKEKAKEFVKEKVPPVQMDKSKEKTALHAEF